MKPKARLAKRFIFKTDRCEDWWARNFQGEVRMEKEEDGQEDSKVKITMMYGKAFLWTSSCSVQHYMHFWKDRSYWYHPAFDDFPHKTSQQCKMFQQRASETLHWKHFSITMMIEKCKVSSFFRISYMRIYRYVWFGQSNILKKYTQILMDDSLDVDRLRFQNVLPLHIIIISWARADGNSLGEPREWDH